MVLCAFLGDALSALGFRLGGVDCHRPAVAPTAGETTTRFERLCGEAELILITAEAAAQLPADLLRRAQLAGRPLVLVIPDVQGRVTPPDQAATLARQLGMGE
jgi:vacuolar-type H+-ATPase subunit F/Vma7